jgi:hypothetical protein
MPKSMSPESAPFAWPLQSRLARELGEISEGLSVALDVLLTHDAGLRLAGFPAEVAAFMTLFLGLRKGTSEQLVVRNAVETPALVTA